MLKFGEFHVFGNFFELTGSDFSFNKLRVIAYIVKGVYIFACGLFWEHFLPGHNFIIGAF
jgi:hypothetical protein